MTNQNETTNKFFKKKLEIIGIASSLFNDNGVSGTMLSEVAQKVGLSANSITYYFKKKEDLVFACLMHSVESIDSIISDNLEKEEPIERLEGVIQSWLKKLSDVKNGSYPAIVAFRDLDQLSSNYSEIVLQSYIALFKKTRTLLSTDVEHDSKNRMSLNIRTHLLLSLIQWIRMWVMQRNEIFYEGYGKSISDIIINGISTHKTHPQSDLCKLILKESVPEKSLRHDFVASAIDLINENGYNGASIDKISAKLNLTKGGFYHHNNSKEDLVSECIRRTFFTINTACRTTLHSDSNGFDKLYSISVALINHYFSEDGPFLRITSWKDAMAGVGIHKEEAPLKFLIETLNDFATQGMKDGTIRINHQSVVAVLCAGMVNGVTTLDKWVPGSEKTDLINLYVKPFFFGIFSE